MNTLSGVSFYDSLNKLSIGALILASVYQWPKETLGNGKNIASGMPDEAFWMLFIIASFIVGIIVQMIVELLTEGWRNSTKLIREACKEDYNKSLFGLSDKEIKDKYYRAYYNVTRHNLLLNVPALEALERFTRTLCIVLPVLVCLNLCTSISPFASILISVCPCRKSVVVLIIWVLIIVAQHRIQRKIHELIWEADYYIKN